LQSAQVFRLRAGNHWPLKVQGSKVRLPAQRHVWRRDARFGVDWIYEVAKKIAEKTA
jgi:hypothetical protein